MKINHENGYLSLNQLGDYPNKFGVTSEDNRYTYLRRGKGYFIVKPRNHSGSQHVKERKITFNALIFSYDHKPAGRKIYFRRGQGIYKRGRSYFRLTEPELQYLGDPEDLELEIFCRMTPYAISELISYSFKEIETKREGYFALVNSKEIKKLNEMIKDFHNNQYHVVEQGIEYPEYEYIESWGRLNKKGELAILPEATREMNRLIKGRSDKIIISGFNIPNSTHIGTYVKEREHWGKVRIRKTILGKFWNLAYFRYILLINYKGRLMIFLDSMPYNVMIPKRFEIDNAIKAVTQFKILGPTI